MHILEYKRVINNQISLNMKSNYLITNPNDKKAIKIIIKSI